MRNPDAELRAAYDETESLIADNMSLRAELDAARAELAAARHDAARLAEACEKLSMTHYATAGMSPLERTEWVERTARAALDAHNAR